MNRDEAVQFLPLIQAFAEGKMLQFNRGDASAPDWIDSSYLDFRDLPSDYRIKPEQPDESHPRP
jgi:hypothetical protein